RLLRERPQRLHGLELALAPVALLVACRGRAEREACPRCGTALPTMLPRQKAARERVVGDHAEPFFLTEREQIALGLAEEQVVAGLDAVPPRHAEQVAA